ncbi:MAG: DUF4261 domain-containing protein [Hyphomicrobiaceae bacterium]
MLDAIKRRLPTAQFEGGAIDEPATAFAGTLDEAFCMIACIGAPNPLSPDESFITSAWWWPDVGAALNQRQAHIIVSVSGVDDAQRRSIQLAKLTAAIIEAAPTAIGVIWDPADAVWQADMFRQSVDAAADALPVAIVMSAKISGDSEFTQPNGARAWMGMTFGLDHFGLMELEVRGWQGDPHTLIGLLLDVGSYVLHSGPVIADGDTMGPEDGGKFRIHHQASTIASGKTV